MGNPNPKQENLIPKQRADNSKGELATSVTGVKLPIAIDGVVRSLPNRAAWLRRVITEAAQRELMNEEEK